MNDLIERAQSLMDKGKTAAAFLIIAIEAMLQLKRLADAAEKAATVLEHCENERGCLDVSVHKASF